MIDFLTLLQVLDSSLRLATPLLLVCLAGLFSERAGIFDIGLEGKLLAAAFVSAAFAAITGSVWLGLLAGILASIMLSLLHGLASITLRGDQIISGVAINFLAAGLTVVIAQDLFGQGGRTPPLKSGGRFEPINFPGATSSKEINDAGPLLQLYSELFFWTLSSCLRRTSYSTNFMVCTLQNAVWTPVKGCWRKSRCG